MLNREISRWQLFAAAVGGIVGSGWLFGPMLVARATGPSSIFAWALGGGLMIFIALTFAELGTTYPVAGGTARYAHFSHGAWVSFTLAWVSFLASVIVPSIETLATVQYAANYIPDLVQHSASGAVSLTIVGIVVSCVIMAVMCLINAYAVRVYAKSSFWIVVWKVLVPLAAAFLLLQHHLAAVPHIAQGGWFPLGVKGMLEALPTAGIIFSFIGYSPAIQLAAEARNPQRAVPFAVLGSIIFTIFLYVFIQFAFIAALPAGSISQGWSSLHFLHDSGPIAALLAASGFAWFVKLIYMDALISPLGTAFIYTGSTARLSYALSKNDYFPDSLLGLNKANIPYKALMLNYFVGILFFLPFPDWQSMVSFLVTCFILAYAVGPIACIVLRDLDPETPRPFKLPAPRFISAIAFIVCNLLIYWSGWDIVWKMFLAVLFGYVYLFAFFRTQKRPFSELSFRAGAWTIPYLLGLLALSYCGSFGGKHYLPFGWDVLIIAAFSIVILILAVRSSKFHKINFN